MANTNFILSVVPDVRSVEGVMPNAGISGSGKFLPILCGRPLCTSPYVNSEH